MELLILFLIPVAWEHPIFFLIGLVGFILLCRKCPSVGSGGCACCASDFDGEFAPSQSTGHRVYGDGEQRYPTLAGSYIYSGGMRSYESLLGVKLQMDKKARILTRQSGSSHAMTLVGCDTDENDKPVKWEFENSWGPAAGHNGYLTFTDKWFDEYMFRLVVKKQYLNEKALEALKGKPVQLPAWDYMF